MPSSKDQLLEHERFIKEQAKGMSSEMDKILEYYKTAEKFYGYSNLEGQHDVIENL